MSSYRPIGENVGAGCGQENHSGANPGPPLPRSGTPPTRKVVQYQKGFPGYGRILCFEKEKPVHLYVACGRFVCCISSLKDSCSVSDFWYSSFVPPAPTGIFFQSLPVELYAFISLKIICHWTHYSL